MKGTKEGERDKGNGVTMNAFQVGKLREFLFGCAEVDKNKKEEKV